MGGEGTDAAVGDEKGELSGLVAYTDTDIEGAGAGQGLTRSADTGKGEAAPDEQPFGGLDLPMATETYRVYRFEVRVELASGWWESW